MIRVNLDHQVAAFLEMRMLAWEIGIASFIREGLSREEAVRKFAEVWQRASLARERRWKPHRTGER
jgi:hypothetical protein